MDGGEERIHWWIERWLECRCICLSVCFPTQLCICLSIYRAVYLFVCLPVRLQSVCCLPFCLFVHPPIQASFCPTIYPSLVFPVSICVPINRSIHSFRLSVYPSLHLPVSLSIYLSACLSLYLSFHLPVSLLSFFLYICLSVYLSKLFCETCLKCGSWKLKETYVFRRGFLQVWKLTISKTRQLCEKRSIADDLRCWRHRANALSFALLTFHLSKVVCLARPSEARSLNRSHKIDLGNVKIWCCSRSREISTVTS